MNVKIILFSVSISTCALSMEPDNGLQYSQQTQQMNQPYHQNPCDNIYYQKVPKKPVLYYRVLFSNTQTQLNTILQQQLQISRQQLQISRQQLEVSQYVAQTNYNGLQELKRTNKLIKTNNILLETIIQESRQNSIINAETLRCLSRLLRPQSRKSP